MEAGSTSDNGTAMIVAIKANIMTHTNPTAVLIPTTVETFTSAPAAAVDIFLVVVVSYFNFLSLRVIYILSAGDHIQILLQAGTG